MSPVGVGFALASALLFISCGEDRSGPPYKPMVDVKNLMIAMVDPAADVLWDAVGTIITIEGVDEWYPETDEEWAEGRLSLLVTKSRGGTRSVDRVARSCPSSKYITVVSSP